MLELVNNVYALWILKVIFLGAAGYAMYLLYQFIEIHDIEVVYKNGDYDSRNK